MNAVNNNYYNLFKKVIYFLIWAFFVFAFFSICYVFVDKIFTKNKIVILFILSILIILLFYFLRNIIVNIFNKIIAINHKISLKKMLFIITVLMIVLRIIYGFFYYFDTGLLQGDIAIYIETADELFEFGKTFTKHNLLHVLSFAWHLSLLRKIGISYLSSCFIFLLLGTLINFISFTKIVGKDKSFLVTIIYVLMPSTIIWSFCITHELLLYLYLSIIYYLLNSLKFQKSIIEIIKCLSLVVIMSIGYTVSPMMIIVYIALLLFIILTNHKITTRIVLIMVLIISFVGANLFSNYMEHFISPGKLNEKNTFHALICGSNVDNYGRFIMYDEEYIVKYLNDNKLEYDIKNIKPIQKEILTNQYKYLLENPMELLRLISNKFYIAWSGNYYSIEMAETYHLQHSNNTSLIKIVDILLMGIGTAFYLLFIMMFMMFNKKNEKIEVMNYKILLLGVTCALLITEIMNKYSQYMMIFIMFIAVANCKIGEEKYEQS